MPNKPQQRRIAFRRMPLEVETDQTPAHTSAANDLKGCLCMPQASSIATRNPLRWAESMLLPRSHAPSLLTAAVHGLRHGQ